MSVPAIFRSTDTGAPVLTNANGTGVAILDAILVTGYATQSITGLTHAAGVITATKTAHGYSNGDVISISGAVPDEYNGRITVGGVTSNTFTYAPVGANPASSPATGTILGSIHGGTAGLGWQLVATATNKRLYRARAGSRMYLGVDDSVNVYEMTVRGFESASAAGVATTFANENGAFPSNERMSLGGWWAKTNNVAGTRAWFAIGDDRMFYWLTNQDNTASHWTGGWFGDFKSFRAGDLYNCCLGARGATTPAVTIDPFGEVLTNMASTGATSIWAARSSSGLPGCIDLLKLADPMRSNSLRSGFGAPANTCLAYPDPTEGTLQLSRIWINEKSINAHTRGYMPGLWFICHNFANMTGVAHDDTCSGANDLAGMNFLLRTVLTQNNQGAVMFETGAAWT